MFYITDIAGISKYSILQIKQFYKKYYIYIYIGESTRIPTP